MTTALGYGLLVVAVGWFLYKLYVSYSSAGGTQFELPVYDAAIYPPVLFAVGLYFVLPNFEIIWPIWAFVAVAVGFGLVAWGAIRLMEEMGDRPLP